MHSYLPCSDSCACTPEPAPGLPVSLPVSPPVSLPGLVSA